MVHGVTIHYRIWTGICCCSETTQFHAVFNNSHWILLDGTIIFLSSQYNGWKNSCVVFNDTELSHFKELFHEATIYNFCWTHALWRWTTSAYKYTFTL